MEAEDVPAAARLLRALMLEFVLHDSTPEGGATVLRENNEEGIRGFIASGFVYHVAEADDALIGFAGMRDRSHLFHMFVDRNWHGQGVARRLWETARTTAIEAGGSGNFTVNASNYAVPVYEAMGFVRTGPTQESKGMVFNPMALAAG
jgi:GNAT superfamily N-acetyltransferase